MPPPTACEAADECHGEGSAAPTPAQIVSEDALGTGGNAAAARPSTNEEEKAQEEAQETRKKKKAKRQAGAKRRARTRR